MRNAALCIVVVEEWVDVEIMFVTSHIGQWRGTERIFRAAPDEEITVAVCHIIHIDTHVDIFVLFRRHVVSHIAAEAHAVVESLFAKPL